MPPNDFRDGFHELKAFARPCAGGDDEMLFTAGIEIYVYSGASEEEREQGQEEYVESFQHLLLETTCPRRIAISLLVFVDRGAEDLHVPVAA